jgi:nucleotide-binding universal stress UspA family protein
MFSNIVVAVDQSEHAMRALAAACNLAKHYDSKLHLLHSPQLAPQALAVGAGAYVAYATPEEVAAAGAAVMAVAVKQAETMGITPASQNIGEGAAAEDTIALADKLSADLIVVGRRGLGGFGSMMLGSTSLKIAHLAPCAILTVK